MLTLRRLNHDRYNHWIQPVRCYCCLPLSSFNRTFTWIAGDKSLNFYDICHDTQASPYLLTTVGISTWSSLRYQAPIKGNQKLDRYSQCRWPETHYRLSSSSRCTCSHHRANRTDFACGRRVVHKRNPPNVGSKACGRHEGKILHQNLLHFSELTCMMKYNTWP